MTQYPEGEAIFVGNSEMAQLMRSLDWSQTPLGEPSNWSQSLKTVLSILLTSQHPIFLWWGQELIQFYNDAYRPILGTTKHPEAMGQPGRDCWQEIWSVIEPMIEAVMEHGEATRIRDGLLILERNGYLEECYFNYAYSPVRDETGEVGGVFCACDETTKRVLSERQLTTLRALAAQPLETKTIEETCQLCMGAIAQNPADLPFALLYLLEEEGESARLMGTAGIEPGTMASPKQIQMATHPWNVNRIQPTGPPEYFADLTEYFDWLPNSIWDVPPQSAIVLPLNQSGQQQLVGVLILAISPRRAFDDEYRGFFELVANQVETAIANAHAHEEEIKRMEALAELDRAKTVFFSNVSHEFRTPLTLMLSPLATVIANLENTLSPQDREQLQLVQRNGERLLKLVNNLLDFSRIEAGRVQVSYEPINLSTYTAELASAFHSLMDQAGLSLIIDCPPLAEAIYIDRDMWEKIVLNLLSNAFKFTLSGTIAIRLHQIGTNIELLVTDTGVGIPSNELPRLFERFHRVENSQGRSFEGSGIGLSLVQELVKLQGGTIQVASTLGQGSCFTVLIPARVASLPEAEIPSSPAFASAQSDAMPYVEEARRWLPEPDREWPIADFELDENDPLSVSFNPPKAKPKPAQAKPKILLADDNADMRRYIQRLLSSSYRVQTVADGVAALEALENERPDLVLTDVMMPRMDGFELLQSLRSKAATQDIPIILLSARAGEESQIEGLEAGADDYLIKPFSTRELIARVEGTLKLAQLRRTAREREQELQVETQIARAKLDQIVSNLRDGFATFDRNWRYTYINNRLLEIIKLPREAVIGRYAWDVFPHQVGITFYDELNRAMNQQVEVQFEFYYDMVNSWVEHRVYPTPEGVAILMADISDRKQTQIALQESEERLRVAQFGAKTGTWDWDVAAGSVIWSPEYYGLFGIDPAILPTYEAWLNTVLEADRAAADQSVRDTLQQQQDYLDFQFRSLHPTQGIRWFGCRGQIFYNADGTPFRAVGIAIDITDRKQTEIALQESEKRLRVAQRSAKIGTWDWNVAADSVIWSSEYYALYGLDPAIPSTYENWLSSILEEDRATADQAVREALQLQQTYLNFEFRIFHPTLGIRWFGSRSQIFYDADGKPTRAIGISIDVTDRKLVEEALRESEQRFRDMADNAPMMVWVTDPTGFCTYLSRSWYDFSGQAEADGLGFGWLEVTHPDDREFSKNIFLSANQRHEAFQLEYRLRRKDGEYRACIDAARPWFGPNGEFQGYIGSVIDIDDRKRAEATLAERARELARLNGLLAESATLLEERNLELDRFVHIVSHDLKAPLRAIANLSQWIEEDLVETLSGDTQNQMNLLRSRVHRMESMIDGLLDYARAGRTDAMIETVSVADLLAEVIDSLAPPPEVEIVIAPNMPILKTKRLLLSQVFSNLIGNAVKHRTKPNGSIHLSVQDQGDCYEFAVTDDGPGIAPEYHNNIFMIFQTVNPQKNSDSSGIGLSIVKKIVETEEGSIRLESQLGEGTTFYFTWPK